MSQRNFFAELKRRNVLRAGAFYAATSWLLVQVATQVFPFFHIAEWVVRWIVVAAAIGFPFWILFSWFYEWTSQGLQRESEVLPNESVTRQTGKKLDRWIIAILLLAVVLLLTDKLVFRPNAKPAAALITDKSIAVLPFASLSEDKANAYFADGVQDEILSDLAKIADLKVISRTSVMQYKSGAPRNLREIGQQLGVAHLLEGSVQRAGGKVRVNAQLIDARTDGHLWGQVYDRPLDDVFAIQSEIAKAIADQLQAKLSPSEKQSIEQPPTTDVSAFDLYSRAKILSLNSNNRANPAAEWLEAVSLLNQALARDPAFFEAYCLLAYTDDQLYFQGFDHTPARLAMAEAAIEKAFRLRPDAGETHLARAYHRYRGYLDYPGALAELEIARRTLPNDARIPQLTGYILRRQGKPEEGLAHLTRALELDPRNFLILQQIAFSYEWLRRYREEAAALDRALSIFPDNTDVQIQRALLELLWKADTQPLHRAVAEIQTKNPEALPQIVDSWFLCALAERDPAGARAALALFGESTFGDDMNFDVNFGKALLARMTKDENGARAAFTVARVEQEKIVQEQPNYGPALLTLALIDAGLGRKEEALQEGRRAMELLPVEKDSVRGAEMIAYFAVTAAWVGEKDLACEQLGRAVPLTSYSISYGRLKLLPWWDPLRGDPRFEKIVAHLAPKGNAENSKK